MEVGNPTIEFEFDQKMHMFDALRLINIEIHIDISHYFMVYFCAHNFCVSMTVYVYVCVYCSLRMFMNVVYM